MHIRMVYIRCMFRNIYYTAELTKYILLKNGNIRYKFKYGLKLKIFLFKCYIEYIYIFSKNMEVFYLTSTFFNLFYVQ